jgi:hypothetical protein
MERRPFTIKEPPFSKRLVLAILFIIAWMGFTPLMVITIGPHVPVLILILLVFGFFALLIILHTRFSRARLDVPNLLVSPCPQCGATPMKFDRGSTGDYVFTCHQCQIEWTMPGAPPESQ